MGGCIRLVHDSKPLYFVAQGQIDAQGFPHVEAFCLLLAE